VSLKRSLLVSTGAGDGWLSRLRKAVLALGADVELITESEVRNTRLRDFDLVLLDASAINDLQSVISAIRFEVPEVRVIVFSSVDDWKRAREVMLAGAVDYAVKSLNEREIVSTLKRCLLRPVPPLMRASDVKGGK